MENMTEQNNGEVPAAAKTSTSTSSAKPDHEVPDPDEDDLDDLDGIHRLGGRAI